jgi:hypothetical protein
MEETESPAWMVYVEYGGLAAVVAPGVAVAPDVAAAAAEGASVARASV